MTLYKLTEQLRLLYELAEDPDTDQQALLDTFEGLKGEIEDKADGYAMVNAQLKADEEALKNEIDRLQTRKRAIENNRKRLMQALQQSMEALDIPKMKTQLFSFTIRNNAASVVIDEQYIENIPSEFVKVEMSVDRAGIKEALKAGRDLEGIAHLESSRSLMIR